MAENMFSMGGVVTEDILGRLGLCFWRIMMIQKRLNTYSGLVS